MDYQDMSKDELILAIKNNDLKYQKVKDRAAKWLSERQEARLLNSTKNNARRKNVENTLKLEDIVIPTHCPILGIELTNTMGKGRTGSNASIDRINPDLGYTPENIMIISDLANRMKQNATVDELVSFANGILKLYITNNNK